MSLFSVTKPNRITVIMLAVGVLITALVDQHLSHSRYENARLSFETRAASLAPKLQQQFAAYTLAMYATQGLVEASDSVTPSEFSHFVKTLQLDSTFSGLHNIGYSPYLSSSQKSAYIKAQRAAGFSDFAIRPDGERSEYAPMQHVYPFNQKLLGMDGLTRPAGREARFSARDSGQTTLSSHLALIDSSDNQLGVLLFTPVYDPKCVCDSVEARRQHLIGWVNAALQIDTLINSLSTASEADEIGLSIYDGNLVTPDSRIYHRANGASMSSAVFSSQQQLTIYNHSWLIQQYSSAAFEAPLHDNSQLINWAWGIACSLLLAGLSCLRPGRD